jgi:hypothetical protein
MFVWGSVHKFAVPVALLAVGGGVPEHAARRR